MPLYWFEYYELTNSVKNLNAEIQVLKKKIRALEKEIKQLKTTKDRRP